MTTNAAPARNQGMLVWLLTIAVVMLCFGLFAMKPLYSVWCRVSGNQLNPNMGSAVTGDAVSTRQVKVYFEAVNFDDLPVRFWPDEAEQNVRIGAEATNVYHFENTSDYPVHFRPIHQISPTNAGKQFGMRICFCFTNQTVGPHETKSFPVVYHFSSDLSPRTTVVTLRYGLFAIDPAKTTDPEELKRQEQRIGAGIVSPGAVSVPTETTPNTGNTP